jgi:uncharacterized membrane protein
MDLLLLGLRLVHIIAAIFWVGGVMVYLFYLMPAARALGPEGGRFMAHLVQQARLSKHLTRAGALAVLSGAWLLWIVSAGFDPAWLASRVGTTLTVSALAGTLAFFIGMINNGPTAERLGALSAEITARGTPADAAETARMEGLRRRLMVGGLANMVLLGIAVGGMAVFRYLGG